MRCRGTGPRLPESEYVSYDSKFAGLVSSDIADPSQWLLANNLDRVVKCRGTLCYEQISVAGQGGRQETPAKHDEAYWALLQSADLAPSNTEGVRAPGNLL